MPRVANSAAISREGSCAKLAQHDVHDRHGFAIGRSWRPWPRHVLCFVERPAAKRDQLEMTPLAPQAAANVGIVLVFQHRRKSHKGHNQTPLPAHPNA